MKRLAEIEVMGDYRLRWSLTRLWRARGEAVNHPLVWMMYNPSTADAEKEDPTLRRVIWFSRAWGYSGALVVNVHPVISANPGAVPIWRNSLTRRQRAMVWDKNLSIVRHAAQTHGGRVLCAWGNLAAPGDDGPTRAVQALSEAGVRLYCLGVTKDNHPKHPMARGIHRVPDDAAMQRWDHG